MLGEYKKHAKNLIALKSVSSDASLKEDCKKTAEYLSDLLASYGFEPRLIEGYGNPVVYASFVVDPSRETALIYGHYDVQDAQKEDGWDTDPYDMNEKNGKLFGRGIMDDKCQLLIHVLTIGKLIKEKKLGYNIKFFLEGNEEEGSPYIEKCIEDNTDLLSCDFILLSDGEMTRGKPTIELGNRGIVNMTVRLTTAGNELHSGAYGGAAPNAVHELSKIIASLYDKNNKLTIDEFYDDVEEIIDIAEIPFDLEEYTKNTGAKAVLTEREYDFYLQTGLRPSLTVTGMYGGYIKEGHKTIIPSSATAKLNFRLVKNQNPKKIGEIVKKHLEKKMPAYVDYDITIDEYALPNKTTADNRYVKKAVEVLEQVFGSKVYYRYVGGTEPVLMYFQNFLGRPIVSVPFANEDGAMHGINENFDIANIEKGIEFSENFFGKS